MQRCGHKVCTENMRKFLDVFQYNFIPQEEFTKKLMENAPSVWLETNVTLLLSFCYANNRTVVIF